jgi:hypothetical protein
LVGILASLNLSSPLPPHNNSYSPQVSVLCMA